MEYIFETTMEVRDYECDIEGIVNNANYLHYAEHTRHLFLRSIGVSFAQLHQEGYDAVVARMKLDFKTPLRCDDRYVSRLAIEKEGLKYIFHQEIYRESVAVKRWPDAIRAFILRKEELAVIKICIRTQTFAWTSRHSCRATRERKWVRNIRAY